MSLPMHVEITGESQGKIDGSCDMKGREKTILAQRVTHKINIPTGGNTGKRVHSPLGIYKAIDASTPKLNQAIVTSELLSEVLVKWYRIDEKGHEEHYYTVKLEKARIVDITLDDEVKNDMTEMETVSFSYERITWRFENPSIETSDTWQGPEA